MVSGSLPGVIHKNQKQTNKINNSKDTGKRMFIIIIRFYWQDLKSNKVSKNELIKM